MKINKVMDSCLSGVHIHFHPKEDGIYPEDEVNIYANLKIWDISGSSIMNSGMAVRIYLRDDGKVSKK